MGFLPQSDAAERLLSCRGEMTRCGSDWIRFVDDDDDGDDSCLDGDDGDDGGDPSSE